MAIFPFKASDISLGNGARSRALAYEPLSAISTLIPEKRIVHEFYDQFLWYMRQPSRVRILAFHGILDLHP